MLFLSILWKPLTTKIGFTSSILHTREIKQQALACPRQVYLCDITPLSFWSVTLFLFHAHLRSQWRNTHHTIVLLTECWKLSFVAIYAPSNSNDGTHLKTPFECHFKVCSLFELLHFPWTYIKTPYSQIFHFDIALFMSGELLKLLPIVEVIVISIFRSQYVFHCAYGFFFFTPTVSKAEFSDWYLFVCICVQRAGNRNLTYSTLYLTFYEFQLLFSSVKMFSFMTQTSSWLSVLCIKIFAEDALRTSETLILFKNRLTFSHSFLLLVVTKSDSKWLSCLLYLLMWGPKTLNHSSQYHQE